jgi:DNA primase
MTILNRIADLYHESLLKNSEPQEYLTSLGITKPAIYQAFKIGYADGTLLNTLPESGELVDELKKIGIITEDGRELLAGRVTFPLYDSNGNIIGMYGRKKGNQGKGKHQYLPGNRGIFNPQAVTGSDEVILTGSVTDALILYQNGFLNATPLNDSDLTGDHLELFHSYRPKRIYLCLNNDRVNKINEPLKSAGFKVSNIELLDNQNLYNFFKSGKTSDDFKKVLINCHSEDEAPEGYSCTENDSGLLINCQEREYRIRGISLHLERLKVNLRATYNGKYHIDTLDLYQSRSRRYLITQLVKLFELDPGVINSDLLYVINEVENFQARKDEAKEQEKVYQMTKEEESEAIKYLKAPDLLDQIMADMENLGHVGEETNKILAYLISVSRKLPKPLSGEIISNSASGKSSLVEIVQELTPPEDVVFYSRITPQALYYMERDALKRKLLIIEERAGGESADYSIRTLQSRQRLAQAVPIRDPNSGKIITKTFEVEGPIAYLETTTNADINHENATRCFEIYLDESVEQTKRIHKIQRESKTENGIIRKAAIESTKLRHHNIQRVLKPVIIEIPFAPLIDFPADNLRTRRDHERFLSLIEAITFLFQYQREQREITINGEKAIVVLSTIQDYFRAYELAKDILGLTLDDLKKHARDLLELVKQLVDQKMAETGEITFTRREIREFTGWQDHQIKAHIKYLEEMEYLTIKKVKERGQFEYQLNNPEEKRPLKGLLTPLELEKALSLQRIS